MIWWYIGNIILFIAIGIAEGFLWHNNVNKLTKKQARKLHIPLVAIRCIWFGIVAYFADIPTMLGLVFCYPFWHLGVLYQTRHLLNKKIYKKGFFDVASTSSTSVIDNLFPIYFDVRLLLLVFGTFIFFDWNWYEIFGSTY